MVPIENIGSMRDRVVVKHGVELRINNVQEEDAGTYECRVTHGRGDPAVASAVLHVTCKDC